MSKDGLCACCRVCKKKGDAEYRLRNLKKLREYDKERRYCPERIVTRRKACKRYDDNNRDKIWSHKKKRMKEDPGYKLSALLRNRVKSILKERKKVGSAVKDLGCAAGFLKEYIESMFYPRSETREEMTWDNWSLDGWHLDHIKPLALFDLTDREQFLEACHYTNLQPLWIEDHKEKTKLEIMENNYVRTKKED